MSYWLISKILSRSSFRIFKKVGTIYGTGKQLVTVPHDSTRYVIQPGSDSIIKDQILSIVAKAKTEDTKVTARFNDQAPLSLSVVNGFYTGTITLPENVKKKLLIWYWIITKEIGLLRVRIIACLSNGIVKLKIH